MAAVNDEKLKLDERLATTTSTLRTVTQEKEQWTLERAELLQSKEDANKKLEDLSTELEVLQGSFLKIEEIKERSEQDNADLQTSFASLKQEHNLCEEEVGAGSSLAP